MLVQHPQIVTNIKSPTSTCHQHLCCPWNRLTRQATKSTSRRVIELVWYIFKWFHNRWHRIHQNWFHLKLIVSLAQRIWGTDNLDLPSQEGLVGLQINHFLQFWRIFSVFHQGAYDMGMTDSKKDLWGFSNTFAQCSPFELQYSIWMSIWAWLIPKL